MNYRFAISQIGLLLIVLSAIMLIVGLWELAVYFLVDSQDRYAFTSHIITSGIGFVLGGSMWLSGKTAPRSFGRREALLLVSMSWLLGATLSAIPFFLWAHLDTTVVADHPFKNFADCYFEAMSGLTTTGATILSDIERLPAGLIFWRAMIHWLGGIGIVVLFVAVLPNLGVGGKKIFNIEAPGPKASGVKPRIGETARVLWLIYLSLTVAHILCLMIADLSLFDATCHAFSAIATGGFSPKTASKGHYNSTTVNYITIVFMILAGANFGLYYLAMKGKLSSVLKDTEFRFYIALLFIGSAIIVFSVMSAGNPIGLSDGSAVEPTFANSLEHGAFTAVSIQTTTGFVTADYDTWPHLAKTVLVLFMFIGGCAGSTSGGIKVIRIWLVFKILFAQVERVFNPNVVRPMRIGKNPIDPDLKLAVLAYAFGIIVLFAVGTVAIYLMEGNVPENTFATASSASLATICTIGPGLDAVGATQNYGWMSDPSKFLLSLWMALGRLEVFAIFVLFLPRFWSNK